MTFQRQALTEVQINQLDATMVNRGLSVALVTCREMLGLPANELVEVIPAKYPRYEVL